jgi:transcriptional regulator with XRE-family HTH domain
MSNNLPENIRQLRAAKGLTQVQLARAARVTSIAGIEAGSIDFPRMKTINAIARTLGVTVAELFAEPKRPRKPRKRAA